LIGRKLLKEVYFGIIYSMIAGEDVHLKRKVLKRYIDENTSKETNKKIRKGE